MLIKPLLTLLILNCCAATAQRVKTIPHDPKVFTQGFIINDHIAWESSGLYNKSFIRQWDLRSGEVLQQLALDDDLFAEGLTELDGQLYLITWRAGKAFKINPNDLQVVTEYRYQGEGWGLTTDGKQLIMSNGSSQLQFIDPKDFSVKKRVQVQLQGQQVSGLNELEWIGGQVWANVFQTDFIVVIDPDTGAITERYHLPKLLGIPRKQPGVLNGIAYDEVHKKIWITGKNWPVVFDFDSIGAQAIK